MSTFLSPEVTLQIAACQVLLTDDCNAAVTEAAVAAAGLAGNPRFSLACFPPASAWGEAEEARFKAIGDACATVRLRLQRPCVWWCGTFV